MFDYVESAGPTGMIVVVSAAALLIAGVAMLALLRTRMAFALYALLIWLPLLFGAIGTRTALREMDRSPVVQSEAIGPRNQKKLRAQLQRPLNLGILATVVLLPLAGVGLATAKKRSDTVSGQVSS